MVEGDWGVVRAPGAVPLDRSRPPDWQPLGQPLLVTCRLDGSLPSHRVFPAQSLTSGQGFVALPKLLRSLNGITAKRANQIPGLTGQAFWQEESCDHWVRDGKQFDRLRAYLEKNPVKAGLVKAPEHYPWSSATKEQAGQGAGCGPGGLPHRR